MKTLLDIRKEETRVQENEMELQIELLRTDQKQWPTPPRFAPICTFAGGLFIPAAKNPDGRCEDFQPALSRQGKACRTCQFVVTPERIIGDRREQGTGVGGSQEVAFYRQQNKENEDADATAKAIEIEQSFYADGRLRTLSFLPSCSILITEGDRHVVPFCNLRHDCKEHRPHIPIPELMFEYVKRTAQAPHFRALEYTIQLVQFVVQIENKGPDEFLNLVTEWAKEEPARALVLPWAKRIVLNRWNHEAAHKLGKAVPREAVTQPSASSEIGLKVFPCIAGCDAYEWGMLAAGSHRNEAAAVVTSGVICQQLAEFLVTEVSPLESASCIDSAIQLIRTDGIFSSLTLEKVDGFLRRLKGLSLSLRLLAQSDLQGYFEDFVAKFSYPVNAWLRLTTKAGANPFQVNLEAQRQIVNNKVASAHDIGKRILVDCAAVSLGTLSVPGRNALLDQLNKLNESGLQRDHQDNMNLQKEIFRNLVGIPLDPATQAQMDQYVTQAWLRVYEDARLVELPRRKLLGTLLCHRGMLPVTTTALELHGRNPQPDRTPETLDEAIWEPVAKTVEAFHVGTFGEPSEAIAPYLRQIRRRAVPRFEMTLS
ncbi:MAG: hypothetical protein H8K04_00275 [Nitrospira sp.]